MASFPSVSRFKVAPAGTRVMEIVRLSTGTGAESVTAALDFTSALRTIEPGGILWGRNSAVGPTSLTAITWTNGSGFPSHALVTFSGMSTAASEKIFDLVLFGRR